MKFGYARVSTTDQNIGSQLDKLKLYGCERIYQEKRSAAKERPELEKMLLLLREGDVIIVTKLYRLGRSLKHLVNLIEHFKQNGVEFISLTDNIDTSTAQGRLMFHLFALFAEFERELIRERTMAGLAAARLKGHYSGRPKGLSKEAKKTARSVLTLANNPKISVSSIVEQLDISKATYYRYLKWAQEEENELVKQ